MFELIVVSQFLKTAFLFLHIPRSRSLPSTSIQLVDWSASCLMRRVPFQQTSTERCVEVAYPKTAHAQRSLSIKKASILSQLTKNQHVVSRVWKTKSSINQSRRWRWNDTTPLTHTLCVIQTDGVCVSPSLTSPTVRSHKLNIVECFF